MRLISLYKLLDAHPYCEALEVLYQILKERPAKANISHKVMPTFQEHVRFVAGQPFRYWYLIKVDDCYVGALQAAKDNSIAIAILSGHEKHGYATEALRLFLDTHEPLPEIPAIRSGHFIANIAPGNEPSVALFRGLGCKLVQETYSCGR